MRDLLHVTGWVKPDGKVATAVLFPSVDLSAFATARRWLDTQPRFYATPFFTVVNEPATYVKTMLSPLTGIMMCPICLMHAIPCWEWRRLLSNEQAHGMWAQVPMQTPSPVEQEAIIARFLGNENALSQLRGGSAMLESVLREVTFPQLPSRNAPIVQRPLVRVVNRPEDVLAPTTRQAPTPAGTIRCTTCHQVIPPGFEKAKDTKKTEDELYDECKHEFDEKTKICAKCNLPMRLPTTRFSWLEVD
jgi:hypothetical protein